jgi:alcohol dehydrogenase
LLDLVRDGKLNALVDRTFALEDVGEAMRVIEDRQVFGKIVVTP